MPCSPKMLRCKPSCRHRQMVTEYRCARAAAEAAREHATADWLIARAAS